MTHGLDCHHLDSHFRITAERLVQRSGEVVGVTIDKELQQYQDLDTVTLYLNPSRQKEYYNYIIGLHPKRVIFNPGTENPELYALLKENNIDFEVACTLVLLSTNQF